ncbi:glycosyltransferase family 2 protein [Pseudoalteromonas sp. S16_S37]|uniref:glycosyltransferase family 2 protein n=1 Tax=Pseudoalteromonas sp. S16_S37 TaxID=2720228 RepID=UPI001680BBD4|nr:glycosyltransferase family 2 protein [Pseudoalteromonas sp. S16_S37]MBD1580955.1 glycosyltransferase family 2 protein [Pseudoalteromonas sp. S16_S37]
MKFTVIIPFYNQQHFVNDTLSSVLAAIRAEDEVIAIDDCSPDNTFDVLKAFAQTDERIHVYQNDENKRQVKTMNRAASLAKGDVLVVLGGDDLLGKGFVHQLIKPFNEGADVVFSPVKFFHRTSEVDFSLSDNRDSMDLTFKDVLFGWGSRAGEKYSIIGCAIKRSTFVELGGFSEDVVIEDHDFFLKAAKQNKTMRIIGGQYAFYRQVAGSISSNMKRMMKEDYKVIGKHTSGIIKWAAVFRRLLSFTAVALKRALKKSERVS